jgi:signal transduction histidine kinase
MKWSIAFKTTALYTALFGLILAAAAGGSAWVLTSRSIRLERLNRVASFVADRFPGMEREHFDLETFAQANRIHIDVMGPRRNILASYGPDPGRQPSPYSEAARQALSREGPVLIRVADLEGPGFAGRLTTGGFLAILAGMLALAAVCGALLVRRMMRPVREMDRTIRQISANDLSTRIDTVHSHDELKELAETFNGMLDRLQKSYEQQTRFVSDASHELRTPLSVISGYANLLRRWGGEDRAVRGEAVGKIIEETENMRRLVERMLFLARADRSTQAVRFERFDFSALMREILEETGLFDPEHVFTAQIEPGVSGAADRALVKQAVRAVLENSIKFTPKGGEISLSCRSRDGAVELAVRDEGIGIPPEDLPHIFDRFYKADASRTRGGKSSSGLGLSIAKWIVERHGGKIGVRSSPGAGTTVTMVFPASPAA